MEVDDLIQYVSQETLLIGMQLETRAFLLVQIRYIPQPSKMRSLESRRMYYNNELFGLNRSDRAVYYRKDEGLYEACMGGHIHLVRWLIRKRGADAWNRGLTGACQGNTYVHMEIIKLLIKKGADNWNCGLFQACQGGSIDSANYMIHKGADNWNWGLEGTCRGHKNEHKILAKLMIEKGADECDECGETIVEHLER